jgi:hypothetical protein
LIGILHRKYCVSINIGYRAATLAKPYALFAQRRAGWNEKIFTFHDFDHPRYNEMTFGVDRL